MKLALAGNQNSGKTTLFNALTGSNQHVGNFPGVTVERKEGALRGAKDCTVVDLPGIYSLRTYTAEELVTREFILNEKPDGLINIVDATNLERNLYLTLQLLELRVPMVVALNMMDEVRAGGGSIDVPALSQRLGVPVVPISAAKGEGLTELARQAAATAESRTLPGVRDLCAAGPVHRCIHAVTHLIEDHAQEQGLPARFCAVKLLENDGPTIKRLGLDDNERETVEHAVLQMERESGLDRDAALADARYAFIEEAAAAAVRKPGKSPGRRRSDAMDRVLTGKYTALPVFAGVMLLIFWLTFDVVGSALSDWMTVALDALVALIDRGLTLWGVNPVVHSLLVDGVCAGVGAVLSFLPIIVTLFFFLSVLEDTGYMARVAFIMDRPLRRFGLSGRSIVPMLIGFGCSVPAILSTRTLSSERDRRLTMLLIPFMSCSAKLPVYAVFTAAFFPRHRALIMGGLYLGGAALALLAALALRGTVFRGKPVPFVMELPDYRAPSPRSVALLLWEKAKDFLQRAFTVIFAATVIIWFLQTFDGRLNVVADNGQSLLAGLGRLLAPVFAPLGFGDWRLSTALVCGFSAKEAVVSTLGVLTGAGVTELHAVLPALMTGPAALAFLVFTLLYTPCAAAVAALRRELGSRAGTLAVVAGQCGVAWVAAFAVYRLALLLA